MVSHESEFTLWMRIALLHFPAQNLLNRENVTFVMYIKGVL